MNNFKKIRTGVIGVGSMGQNHARVYSEISNLVGVADPDKEQGTKIANLYGAKWFKDYEEMLSEVDAVSISVPTFMHEEVSKNASNANVNILVEKPLAANTSQARSIIEFCEKKQITLGVGHVERFNPVINSVRSFLSDSSSDKISTICARRFSPYPARISDVGVLFDLTIHDVDIIRNLSNSVPISVYASGGKLINKDNEDFVNVILNFENGITGLCQTNWLTPFRIRDLSITTKNNFIKADYLSKKVQVINSQSEFYLEVKDHESLKLELVDFLDSVQNNKEPKVSGKEGLLAVEIVEAAIQSMKEDKLILL